MMCFIYRVLCNLTGERLQVTVRGYGGRERVCVVGGGGEGAGSRFFD